MTRLLMLNWRDWTHPRAGGAELFTYEVVSRLVAHYGYDVTVRTALYPGAARREVVSPRLRIERAGTQRSVHWQAYRAYRSGPERFDVVVDQINTIPFLTPLYVRTPLVALIHQLAREVWWHEAPLVAPLGYPLENLALRLYRQTPVLTVSQSTKDDLIAIGHPADTITIVPQGSSLAALPRLTKKSTGPRIAFLARLVASKRPDHALRAFAVIRAAFPTATLTVMGRAKYRWYERSLRMLVQRLGMTDAVTFAGFVDDASKQRIIREATVLLVTSAREGWGLIVTEAGALGTPSAVYDVPGLRDAVGRGTMGALSAPTPDELGATTVKLLENSQRYERLRHAAWQDATTRNWDRTTEAVHDHLQRTIQSFASTKFQAPNSK